MVQGIRKRIYSAGILIVAMIILSAGIVLLLHQKTIGTYDTILEERDNTLLFRARFIDHLNWMNNLLESITLEKEFTGQVDPTQCAFGKWYYSVKGTEGEKRFSLKQDEIFKQIESHHTALHRSATAIKSAESKREALGIYQNQTKASVTELQRLFTEFITLNEAAETELRERSSVQTAMIRLIIILSITAIAVGAGFMIVLLTRRILGSLKKMEKGIYRLSHGDLTTPMETKLINCSETRKCNNPQCSEYGKLTNACFLSVGSYAPLAKNTVTCPAIIKGKFKDCQECAVMQAIVKDEIDFVMVLLDHFREKVRGVLKDVLGLVFSMASSTEEMSAAITSFSENIQSQAASAEEITATVEQVGAGFENIARSTLDQYDRMAGLNTKMGELTGVVAALEDQTRETLTQTETIARQARGREESLGQMKGSMEKIYTSSGEMKNIISIINEISEKINLLSLNAAIEAARAGDFGRGFAVVADEISKLADQTATSIKDISSLIQENDSEISKGMVNIQDTFTTIGTIINGVGVINSMMEKISDSMKTQIAVNNTVNGAVGEIQKKSDEMKTATDEQKVAFDEIVRSVTNINELTQSNASSAEELASSSEEIAGTAETVKNEIDFFKV